MQTKFCMSCGTKLPIEARFCSACGARQELFEDSKAEESVEQPILEAESLEYAPIDDSAAEQEFSTNTVPQGNWTPEKEKRESAASLRGVLNWVSCGLALLLSVVMLVMAFLPITTYRSKIPLGDMEGVEVSYSIIDTMVLFFDSLQSLDEEELQDSELMDDIQKCFEECQDEFGNDWPDEYSKLSLQQKSLLNRYLLLVQRWNLTSEDVVTTPDCIAGFVFAILYFVLLAALLVIGILRLLAMLGIQGLSKSALKKWQIALFCAVPMLLFVQFFNTLSFGNETLMAGGTITTMILSGILIAFHIILAMVVGELKWNRNTVVRLISAVTMIALMIVAFTPVVATEVRTIFAGKESKKSETMWLNVACFMGGYLSENEIDDMESLYDSGLEAIVENVGVTLSGFSSYSVRDVRDGKADAINVHVFQALGVGNGFYEVSWLFGIISLLYVLAVLALCLCLWQNLVYFAGGRYCSVIALIGKILAFTFFLVALALIITFVVLMSSYANEYVPRGYSYSVSIAAGAIVACILSVAHMFCPARLFKKKTRNVAYEVDSE